MSRKEMEDMFDQLVEQFNETELHLTGESYPLETCREMFKLMDKMFVYLERKFNSYG